MNALQTYETIRPILKGEESSKQASEETEFFDSLIITYRSGAVVSYACSHQRRQIASIPNTPVFHDHPEIKPSAQLELFDISQFQLRYVSRRPPNRKHLHCLATSWADLGIPMLENIP